LSEFKVREGGGSGERGRGGGVEYNFI
jgi:hypothetical protein